MRPPSQAPSDPGPGRLVAPVPRTTGPQTGRRCDLEPEAAARARPAGWPGRRHSAGQREACAGPGPALPCLAPGANGSWMQHACVIGKHQVVVMCTHQRTFTRCRAHREVLAGVDHALQGEVSVDLRLGAVWLPPGTEGEVDHRQRVEVVIRTRGCGSRPLCQCNHTPVPCVCTDVDHVAHRCTLQSLGSTAHGRPAAAAARCCC